MLRSFVSFVIIFIRVIKTGYNQLHIVTYYLPSTIYNLEPHLSVTLDSVPVKMKGCEDMHFKQRAVIEFLTVEKIPPIYIHHHMQVLCWDKYVDINRLWV
jgi:hypothetical protein